nr:hypothetical protein [Tanacetum cinerariifolium]
VVSVLPTATGTSLSAHWDILIPKDLPSNNTFSFAKKKSFYFDIPLFSHPPAKPPDGDTGILNIKMMGDIFDQKAFMQKLIITLASHQEKSPDLLSHRCGTVKKFNTHPNTRYWKIPTFYDDGDDDYTFAITPIEPDNSEHFDTIPATKSDEFIKFSVENLVLIPSESKGEPDDDQSFSDDDFSKEIYSNLLFDEEIISMKIGQHHFNAESDIIESLLNHESSIISSLKIDSLFDEFADELTLLNSIPPGIDETNCDPKEETDFIKRLLYDNSFSRPPKEFVYVNSDAEIESFSPSLIPVKDNDSLMKEIDLSFTLNYPMLSGIEEDDYNSKKDILILEELLSNDSLSVILF